MRLFPFYAFCAVKNTLRRLFKTWVAVLLAVCFVFGILIGLGAVMLEDLFGEEMPDGELPPGEEDILPPGEGDEWIDEEWTEEETKTLLSFTDLAVTAVILALLAFEILSSDKNGNVLFLPADVNILFPSPMRPQSVLLFRLLSQMGATILLGIYLLFQLPNLVVNIGLSVGEGFLLLLGFCLLVTCGKLTHVFLYTLGATRPRVRKLIRPGLFALLFALLFAFYLYSRSFAGDYLSAALSFCGAKWTRFFPLFGWLKGLFMYTLEGDLFMALLSLGLLLCGIAALTALVWHMKADFYEDAMAKSAETAEIQQSAAEGRTILATRKKERGDRIRRDGLRHGHGANVYFFKSLYNRFRFAHFRVLTKTSETYLCAAVLVYLLCRLALSVEGTTLPIMLTLGGLCFFRALGNPVATDVQTDAFLLLPEGAHAKVFWSLAAGTANCFLDLLPATALAALLPGGQIGPALLLLLFILSVDLYASNAALFIDLSLPTAMAKQVKTVVLVMFIYFGLMPDILLLLVGFAMGNLPLFLTLAAALNAVLSGIFYAFSPLFIAYGRK